MARTKRWTPLSLAQRFDAPEDYTGEFGWVVGYSADAAFLNDAVERFSRRTLGGRAFEGKVRLALILDPGNPQIPPADVPGILHLPLKAEGKPFRLLHAKVALLGFRHEAEQAKWRMRVIVSTGNWTRQTLEESLDLAWVIDIDSQELVGKFSDELKLRCADFQAAWECIDYLRAFFDIRALNMASDPIAGWMASVPLRKSWPKPRFFDNRNHSLLEQLPEMVKRHGSDTARNHISMGSGFYESSTTGDVPSVPGKIVDQLHKHALLTNSAEVRIFVERYACQAVASAAKAIHEKQWWICSAGLPEQVFGRQQRSLHAKFLFSANYRDGSNNCNSAWIYIGSGNLTGPGFANVMSAKGGNLEAGVVFAPPGLEWYHRKGIQPEALVSNILPVQWETSIEDITALIAGGDMLERHDRFLAPPVAWIDWKADDDTCGWLSIPDECDAGPFDVLHGDTPCQRNENGFRWPGEQPRQVELRWLEGEHPCHATVPVRDEYGLLATARLPRIEIADAWPQLANFPMPPDDEDIPGDDQNRGSGSSDNTATYGSGGNANYPIRHMMEFLENIADKQTAINEADWASWLSRLEQTLFQMSDCAVLNEFRELGLNPLSPLLEPAFRPTFAETGTSEAGRKYEDVLARTERKWGVVDRLKLGAAA